MTLARKMREAASAVREAEPEPVPAAPAPDAADAATGTETAQSLAARYLPRCVALLAGVAFGKGSGVKLHTRVVAVGHLIRIASGLADEVPAPGDGCP